jgi:hypothetical protein
VFDTFGLGAGQNVMYDSRGALGVASSERFYNGVDPSFMARPNGRDLDFYSWGALGAPGGTGSRRA